MGNRVGLVDIVQGREALTVMVLKIQADLIVASHAVVKDEAGYDEDGNGTAADNRDDGSF